MGGTNDDSPQKHAPMLVRVAEHVVDTKGIRFRGTNLLFAFPYSKFSQSIIQILEAWSLRFLSQLQGDYLAEIDGVVDDPGTPSTCLNPSLQLVESAHSSSTRNPRTLKSC